MDSRQGPAAPDLEAGIAAIFARLRAAADGPAAPPAAPADDRVTFDLLGELDRLWRGDRR